MSRRNKDYDVGDLFKVLFGAFIVCFFIIKWLIEGIILIFNSIITLINWISQKATQNKKKKEINNIVTNSFTESNIKPVKDIKISKLKKQLGMFDKDIYNNLFEEQIRRRGVIYYSENKIRDVNSINNKYTCLVDGTKTYNVSIEFDDNDNVKTSSCTCPYYQDKKKNCKHIYALLIKAKCEENPLKILKEIESYSNKMTKMVNNATEYIEKNRSNLNISKKDLNKFNNLMNDCQIKFTKLASDVQTYENDEEILLEILEELIENSFKIQLEFKKILSNNNTSNNSTTKSYVNNEDKLSFLDIVTGVAVANAIDNHLKPKDDEYDEKLEKRMNDYCLEDCQKDLVRKGEHNIWDFEEDGELEEEDYYYEDS